MKHKLFALAIVGTFLLAGLLRLMYGNWDQGYHMHPDERAIVLSVIELNFPPSIETFFSPDSPWNPKFFAYGSMPFYLLYVAGQLASFNNPLFSQYDGINLVGRVVSAFFDLGTLLFVFLIGRLLMPRKYALIGMFLYALSVLPIQLSHFYAVDTLLTFFITATLYFLLKYYQQLSLHYALLIGICFGAALATKISASVLIVSIGAALCADYVLLFIRQPHKPKTYLPHLPVFLKRFVIHLFVILLMSLVTFAFLEPYALIDFPTFLSQTLEQSHMTDSAFTFPYTLQYVGKMPYIYELKNLLLYGMGPVIAFFCLSGILLLSLHAVMKQKEGAWAKEFILVVYFWTYFIIVGSFAIGFMRYMLPLYPLLTIAGAFFVYQGFHLFPALSKKPLVSLLLCVFLVLTLIWPLTFMQIYTRPHTRVQATNWITENIPPGSTIAIEHWDDALPLTGQEHYTMETLALYDPDTPEKWKVIREQLNRTDYIILASNRLYTPLMKLTDCKNLPPGRCYTDTASYYQSLFGGTLGFQQIADISSYPTLPFTSIAVSDQGADESFTVYDHPRVLIFKRIVTTNRD